MPWWAAVYVSLYFSLAVLGDMFAYRRQENTTYWLVESITHLGVGVMLLGCWYPIIPASLSWLAVLFMAFAVLWEIITGSRDTRELLAREETSTGEKIFEIALTLILIGPAYVGACYAAFRAFG